MFGKTFCSACAARPEVNYLEGLRLQYWGKRDSWAWFYGLNSLGYLAAASQYVFLQQDYFVGALCLVGAGLCVCYWLGLPWARYVMVAMPLAFVALGMGTRRYEIAALSVFSLIVSVSPLTDMRNKLFFKVPVTEKALQKYWNVYVDNRAARNGATLAMAGLIIPIFIPFGFVFSIIGLLRVNPNAHPPIGKKFHAVAGIVLSIVASALWIGFYLARFR